MAYITGADIESRMGSDAFLRAFDRDGDGAADASLVEGAIVLVESTIDTKLRATHGTPFVTPPEQIKQLALLMAPYAAVMMFPGNNGGSTSPYKGPWDYAMDMLKDLSHDNVARLPGPLPEPVATLSATAAGIVDASPLVFGDTGKSGF